MENYSFYLIQFNLLKIISAVLRCRQLEFDKHNLPWTKNIVKDHLSGSG